LFSVIEIWRLVAHQTILEETLGNFGQRQDSQEARLDTLDRYVEAVRDRIVNLESRATTEKAVNTAKVVKARGFQEFKKAAEGEYIA
jgi:hypothetical protein